jgi:hypothetical protein
LQIRSSFSRGIYAPRADKIARKKNFCLGVLFLPFTFTWYVMNGFKVF